MRGLGSLGRVRGGSWRRVVGVGELAEVAGEHDVVSNGLWHVAGRYQVRLKAGTVKIDQDQLLVPKRARKWCCPAWPIRIVNPRIKSPLFWLSGRPRESTGAGHRAAWTSLDWPGPM